MAPLLLADWFCAGDESGDQVGHAVAHIGDVNGDEYSDIVVGAPYDQLDMDRAGIVSVFYGAPDGLPTTPNWQAGGSQQGARFGAAVAGAGDVNGDGHDDLLVGVPGYNDGVNRKGAAFLFLGSFGGLEAEPAWFFVGDQKDSLLGTAVAGVGDVNGDGFGDFVIGAPRQSASAENEGAVFLFLGSDESISPAPDWSYLGGLAGASLGTSLAGAGDVNGDGHDDILAGVPGYGIDHEDEGAAFLFLGAETGLAASPDWQALGGQPDTRLGTSVSGAGDVNGDSYDDLLVGAPGYASAGFDTGAAFLFYGGDPLPANSAGWMSRADQPTAGFGHAVAGVGDLDADGYDDVAVGAYTYTNDQRAEGAVFVFYGAAGGLGLAPGWQAEGDKADTEFGYAIDLTASLRGGSPASLLIGAPRYRQGTEPEGRAFVFYGPLQPQYWIHLPLIQCGQP